MRWSAVLLTVFLSAAVGFAQIAQPITYGFSNSVIDHNGRVLVFDGSYLYTPPPVKDVVQPVAIPIAFPPTVRTQVTIIEADASSKQSAEYDGNFQIVGVGRYAVYAIVTNYSAAASSGQAPTSTRQLVALGAAFPTLPSIDVPSGTDVKISAVGDDGALDTIAFMPIVITPLAIGSTGIVLPVPPTPTLQRTVQMYRSDGKSFTTLPPVTIPNP